MDIILSVSKKHIDSVITKINKNKTLYSDIKCIQRYSKHIKFDCIIISHNKLNPSDDYRNKLKKKYEKLQHVYNIDIIPVTKIGFQKNMVKRDCRFIFDVDSTLTYGKPNVLAAKSTLLLKELQSCGYWVYFATGRGDGDLIDLIEECGTENEGIAENGGLLVLSKSNTIKIGDKSEPNKAYWCLKKKYGTRVKQDMSQGSRITERIIKNNLSKKEYEVCTKNYSVQILSSKNAYHITAKGIDKGRALKRLASVREWGDDFIIAVGDSDLDVPMFKAASVSFAVSNSSNLAKKFSSQVLDNSYDDGVKEMINQWFKS